MKFDFWKKKRPQIGTPISVAETAVTLSVSSAAQVSEAMPIGERQLRAYANAVREVTLTDYTRGTGSLAGTLSAMWSKTADDKKEFKVLSDELRKFWIYNTLLSVIAEDVLNADENGQIIELTSQDERIKSELEILTERVDFDSWLTKVTKDVIDYGEYALRLPHKEQEEDEEEEEGPADLGEIDPTVRDTEPESVGVYTIEDDVDQINFLALYDGAKPAKYLISRKTDFELAPAGDYVHFVAGSNTLRFKIENIAHYTGPDSVTGIMPVDSRRLPPKLRKELPDYARVGEPMFHSLVTKLRDLQLLEQLVPATKLNQLTQSQMVSVKVPTSVDPKQVMDVLQRYEDILNKPVGINVNTARITLAQLLSATQKIRVIPDFSDEKGALTALQIRNNQTIDDILNALKDIREILASSLGIPPSILFGATENRATELRKHSRYVKKIAELRRSIAHGIEHVVLTHLARRGIKATKNDFKINFKTALVDVSVLEKMELDDAMQAVVSESIEFANRLQSNPLLRAGVDPIRFLKWLRKGFEPIMDGESFFKTDEELERDEQMVRDAFAQPLAMDPGGPGNNGDSGDLPQQPTPTDGDEPSSSAQSVNPQVTQQVIALRNQGKTHQEIANQLRITVNNVGSILRKYQKYRSE